MGQPTFLAVSAPPLGASFQGTYNLEIYPYMPPKILEGTLADAPNPSSIRVILQLEEGSEDVQSVSLRVLDQNNLPLWSLVYGETWNQGLLVEGSGENTTATVNVDLSSFEESEINTVEIRLLDALDGFSEPLLLSIP